MSQLKRKASDDTDEKVNSSTKHNLNNNWLLKKKKVDYLEFKVVAKRLFTDGGDGKLTLLDQSTFEYAAVSYFWENEYAESAKKQEFSRTMRIFVQLKPRLSFQKVTEIVGVKGLSEWILEKDERAINAGEANFATIGNCQKYHKAGVLRLKVSV